MAFLAHATPAHIWLIHGAFMLFALFVDREDVFQGAIGVFLEIIGIMVGLTSLKGALRGGGVGAFARQRLPNAFGP